MHNYRGVQGTLQAWAAAQHAVTPPAGVLDSRGCKSDRRPTVAVLADSARPARSARPGRPSPRPGSSAGAARLGSTVDVWSIGFLRGGRGEQLGRIRCSAVTGPRDEPRGPAV